MFTYLVPADTAPLVSGHFVRCRNLSLILSRYIPKEAFDKTGTVPATAPNVKKGQKWRDYWLTNQVCPQFVVVSGGDGLNDLFTNVLHRWRAQTSGATHFRRRLEHRLIVGLGGKGPLEFGITLHPVTGLPFIPGSALKGLCRSFALLILAEHFRIPVLSAGDYLQKSGPTPIELLDNLLSAPDDEREESLKKLLSALDEFAYTHPNATVNDSLLLQDLDAEPAAGYYRFLFGNTSQSGVAIFFDGVMSALSSSSRLFELDVMTPHFGEYYRTGQETERIHPPSDDQAPVPVSFLTVAAGTEFSFAVGLRHPYAGDPAAVEAEKTASVWLRQALHMLGIGSKTAAGYGVFEPNKPIANGST